MPTIRISDEIDAYIKENGKFGDTHDDVLRRCLKDFDQRNPEEDYEKILTLIKRGKTFFDGEDKKLFSSKNIDKLKSNGYKVIGKTESNGLSPDMVDGYEVSYSPDATVMKKMESKYAQKVAESILQEVEKCARTGLKDCKIYERKERFNDQVIGYLADKGYYVQAYHYGGGGVPNFTWNVNVKDVPVSVTVDYFKVSWK